MYNTAADKSNFTVMVHTEKIKCQSSTLYVYGIQTANPPTDNNLNTNKNHFIGQFKKLTLNNDESDRNVCKYMLTEEDLWPYIYLRVSSNAASVKVCEVIFA